MNLIKPQAVRELVRRVIAELSRKVPDLSEAFLIRDGHYCGYRFWDAELSAVWFTEEEQIKFYNPIGKTIRVIDLKSMDDGLKQAA